MSITIQVVSWIAFALTVIMFTPQALKSIVNKNVDDLEKTTFLMILGGTLCFLGFSPFVNSWPMFSSNLWISILMCVMIFLMFKNRKWVFFLICIITIGIATFALTSLIMTLNMNIIIKDIIKYVFSIFAMIFLCFAFLPQTIAIIKIKKIGHHVSFLSIVIVMAANITWVIFYILSMTVFFDPSFIFGMIASISGAISQIPIILIQLFGNNPTMK